MAKAFYNEFTNSLDADSCGTRVGEFEGQKIKDIKNDSVEDDIRAMKEYGLDVSDYTRKQVTEDLVQGFDKVIVMAEKDTWPDYLKENGEIIFWDVENPKGTSFEKTCEIRDIIRAKVKEFVDAN